MTSIRKALALLLACVMIFALAACGANSAASDNSGASSADDQTANTTANEPAPADDDGAAPAVEDSAEEPATAEPVYGGEATIFFTTISSDIDPAAPDFKSYMLWYEQLFVMDWGKEDTINGFKDLPVAEDMTGQIADTWQWDPDAQTFTVTIRDDITFQTLDSQYDYYGGRSLTAADVKYSYDRALGTGSGFDAPVASMNDWPTTYYMIDSIEVVDDLTVVFHFNTSSDVAVDDFMEGMLCIAGPEFDALTDDQKLDWHYACGTGPYILTDYVQDSYMTFTKNENYYDYDERHPENKLPYLDSVTLVKITDTATLLSEFIAGQIDIIGNNQSVFSASELAHLAASMDASAYGEYAIDITSRGVCLKQTCEPLKDINVRQALQYAINLEEISTAYYGFDDVRFCGLFGGYSKFSNAGNWSDDLLAAYTTYDPELAKQMLADAGYPDGFTFTLAYNADGDTDIYALVAEYLAAVGVTMELYPISIPPEYFQVAQSSDNDISSISNLSLTNTNIAINSFVTGGPFNALGASEPEIDAIVSEALAAQSREEKTAKMHEFDEYLMNQHYMLLIGPVEQSVTVVNSKIGGYNGESFYAGWNGASILPRIWSNTGE